VNLPLIPEREKKSGQVFARLLVTEGNKSMAERDERRSGEMVENWGNFFRAQMWRETKEICLHEGAGRLGKFALQSNFICVILKTTKCLN